MPESIDKLHFLSLLLIVYDHKHENDLESDTLAEFDAVFLGAVGLEKDTLETAFRDRAYAIEAARTLLS